jgi:hypothetical protein
MTTRIKLRRDTEANWLSNDPILALGEAGHDTTNNELRIGDGTSTWSALAAIGGASTSGNILLSANESHQLTLNNNGFLLGGDDGYDDIRIGQDDDNEVQRAYILISQDDPYIRSEVLSTTTNNYRNEMVWHNPWYSRYSKIYTNAYGAHIQNAQWSGPGNDYFNRFSFTRDGVFNMPPAAVIRSNDYQSAAWYDPIQDEDINDDQSPFAGTLDSSLTFDANSISIARGSLNMNGVSNASDGPGGSWIAMAGSFGQGGPETAQEGSCVDPDGNTYTLQVAYSEGTVTAVTKWSAAGERLWQRGLWQDSTTGGPTGSAYPVNISYEPDSGNLFIALNEYNPQFGPSNETPIFIAMTTNGNQVDDALIIGSSLRDLNVNDFVSGVGRSWADGSWAAVGRAANGRDYYTPNFDVGVANYSINGGTRLVVNTAATFGEGLRPTTEGIANADWFMFGPDLTGNVQINTINTIVGEAAARTTGAGTGTDAAFNVSFRTSSPVAYVVTIATAGTNYANDDVLVITGDKLGGTTPANDLTLTITTEGGIITGVTPTGSPTLYNTVLSLSGNPQMFSNFEYWNDTRILAQTSTDALLITRAVFNRTFGNQLTWHTMGNIGWDTFNAVAFSTVSNNLYVGGRYHPLGNNGSPRRSVLAKLTGTMGDASIVWQVEVDDYTGRNEIRGIAVDAEDNIGVIAFNDRDETVVTKVSGSGTMQWQRIVKSLSFGPSTDNDTYGIGVDALGNFIITARSHRGDDFDGNNEDLVIASFGPDGDLQWSRSLGTVQNEYSRADRTFRNITVNNDTMVITGSTYAGGFRVTHPSDTVGFVAKLPTDGTGIGHYGEWRYLNLPLEIEVVSNTAANTATLSFTQSNDIDWDNNSYTYANTAVRSGGMTPEFLLPSITYQAGGPGEITGLNRLVFTNGSSITNYNEEGLMLWQPDQGYNAEYIALAYGGDDAVNANVIITAGSYNWATDDGNLNDIYYPDNGAGQSQRQVNIDIVGADGIDADNLSNWHFDEDGSLYLPAQNGLAKAAPVTLAGNVAQANNVTQLTISKTTYPDIGKIFAKPLDHVIYVYDYYYLQNKTIMQDWDTTDPVNWLIYVPTDWFNGTTGGGTSQISLTTQNQNGIVFNDGSKQVRAGSKVIPGSSPGNLQGRIYGYINTGGDQAPVWTSSSGNVNAFRGTFRCQFGDTSTEMKMYDITGASYLGGEGGYADIAVTELISVHSSITDPVTFSVNWNPNTGVWQLIATAPAGSGPVYVTCDVTEFQYTSD